MRQVRGVGHGPDPDVAVRAAGAVLYRRVPGGGVEVAVIHRPDHSDWTLPKGKLDPGEQDLEAAIREVLEEAGWVAEPGAYLGETRYTVMVRGRPRPKVVRFWAMLAVSGGFAPTGEVDDLRWLPVEGAQKLLSYGRDREMLKLFAKVAF